MSRNKPRSFDSRTVHHLNHPHFKFDYQESCKENVAWLIVLFSSLYMLWKVIEWGAK